MVQIQEIRSGNKIDILHPLRHPNWASAWSTVAWFWQPVQNVGIENLSIDTSAGTILNANTSCIEFIRTAQSWVKDVRLANCPTFGIYTIQSLHDQFQDVYLGNTVVVPPTQTTHAVNLTMDSDSLVVNNIAQGYMNPLHCDGPCDGTAFAYNYVPSTYYPSASNGDTMTEALRLHSAGNSYILAEGNVLPTIYADDTHGTEPMVSGFRNFFSGWETCSTANWCNSFSAKAYHTNPVILDAYARGHSFVGNVLGTPGYHTNYSSSTGNQTYIYIVGEGLPSTPAVPADTIVASTMLRWGNYDIVNAATQFVAGEVPTGAAAPFTNASPLFGNTGQQAIPASYIFSSKPAWFQSIAWPAIGPDVTSGNVGQCSGTLGTAYNGMPTTSTRTGCTSATAWGGHVNAIPAMNCYLNVMNGPLDGSGPALAFNTSTCYAVGSSGLTTGFMGATSLKGNIKIQ